MGGVDSVHVSRVDLVCVSRMDLVHMDRVDSRVSVKEKELSLTQVLEEVGIPVQRNKLGAELRPFTKTNSNWVTQLHAQHRTPTLLAESLEENVDFLSTGMSHLEPAGLQGSKEKKCGISLKEHVAIGVTKEPSIWAQAGPEPGV